jgi:hypothetical protein
MAELDVSEALDSPEFLDTFYVTRAQQVIDRHGRAHPARSNKTLIPGVVQAAGGRTLNMMPDLVSVNGVIDIWTRFRLEGPSDTTQADVVTWQDRDYTVATVQSWTNYGRGFVHAVCQMKELTADAPTRVPTDDGP